MLYKAINKHESQTTFLDQFFSKDTDETVAKLGMDLDCFQCSHMVNYDAESIAILYETD